MVVIRRVLLPVVLMVSLWMMFVAGVTSAVDASFGPYSHERLEPLMNVHLAEEALEGTYSPVEDPAFIAYAVLKAALVFGVGGLYAAFGAVGSARKVAVLPCAVSLGFLWVLFVIATSPHEALSMRAASALQILLFVTAYLAGRSIAFRVGRGTSARVPN
jgi:hypothetical protein